MGERSEPFNYSPTDVFGVELLDYHNHSVGSGEDLVWEEGGGMMLSTKT